LSILVFGRCQAYKRYSRAPHLDRNSLARTSIEIDISVEAFSFRDEEVEQEDRESKVVSRPSDEMETWCRWKMQDQNYHLSPETDEETFSEAWYAPRESCWAVEFSVDAPLDRSWQLRGQRWSSFHVLTLTRFLISILQSVDLRREEQPRGCPIADFKQEDPKSLCETRTTPDSTTFREHTEEAAESQRPPSTKSRAGSKTN
jgi:hypothetical protein